MKITTSREALFKQLATVARAASSRSAVQALSGVQFVAGDNGGVELRATDMEVSLRVPLDAEVQRAGAVVLPARLLSDIVRALPNKDVTLEVRQAQQDVEVVAGTAQFHVRVLRSEDFPAFPEPQGDPVVIDAKAFVSTAATVSPSASRDETRPVLTGILVEAEGNLLKMTATDSYRLSVRATLLETALVAALRVNIPARALGELERLVGLEEADELTISALGTQVVFEVGGSTLSSRLIDGQFPNVSQLLPSEFEHELPVNASELSGVVKRMSLLAQKNSPLRLAFTEGELTVSARTQDVGEARETIPVQFAGEPMEIGFSAEFLYDGLQGVSGDDALLKVISPLRPGMVTPAVDDGYLYLLMPIRLNI